MTYGGKMEWGVAMLRVLVVDDDTEFRSSVAETLASMAVVSEVATAVEAVWLMERTEIDVIICDLRLATTTTGADVLEVVRQEWPSVLRILVTGFGAEAVHRAPAHACLFKPLDVDQLCGLVRAHEEPRRPSSGTK
jgi:DNA-binding NtrC family response regulator